MHAHLDLFCGASGDMLLGALVDAGLPLEELQRSVAALGLDGVTLSAARVSKLGIAAAQVTVNAPAEHHHRHLPDIERIITGSALSEPVRNRAVAVFRTLARAEAAVHGVPVDAVHFHEVGAVDAMADVVGVTAGLDFLGVSTVSCRALPASHGTRPLRARPAAGARPRRAAPDGRRADRTPGCGRRDPDSHRRRHPPHGGHATGRRPRP